MTVSTTTETNMANAEELPSLRNRLLRLWDLQPSLERPTRRERAVLIAFLIFTAIYESCELALHFSPTWRDALRGLGVTPIMQRNFWGPAIFALAYLITRRGKFLLATMAVLALSVYFVGFMSLGNLLLEPPHPYEGLRTLASLILPSVWLAILWRATPERLAPRVVESAEASNG